MFNQSAKRLIHRSEPFKPFKKQLTGAASSARTIYVKDRITPADSRNPAPEQSGTSTRRPKMTSAALSEMPNKSQAPLLATRHITLSEDVQKLRLLLLDAAKLGEGGPWKNLELRFAGGWVRDMLLGIKSNDIDVALSSVTGFEFATFLKDSYLDKPENLKKHGLSSEGVGKTYKVEANPEKSKQLETASLKLNGIDLDFVNLRKEVYDTDSRTPHMEFGTAVEDAYRRDATINALFYNLHTEQVEDFVGGLVDLDSKRISTPLEPYQTFIDDPLRVLRLVRFASRLGFTIDEQTREKMSDPEVLKALKKKISRERVGIEVDKMLKAHNPRSSLQLFDSLGLFSTVFTDDIDLAKPTNDQFKIDTAHWSNAYDCMYRILGNSSPRSLRELLVHSDVEDVPKCWLLAALAPLSQAPPPPAKQGKRLPPYAARVAREGLKQTNKTNTLVAGAINHLGAITDFKKEIVSGESYADRKDVLGMAIRTWEERGGEWKLQVVFAILVEAMQVDATQGYEEFLAGWQQFLDHLSELGIMDAAARRRLIDGQTLKKELQIKKVGPWMKEALDLCMAWQFRNPDSKNISAAVEEVRKQAGRLEIPLE